MKIFIYGFQDMPDHINKFPLELFSNCVSDARVILANRVVSGASIKFSEFARILPAQEHPLVS